VSVAVRVSLGSGVWCSFYAAAGLKVNGAYHCDVLLKLLKT